MNPSFINSNSNQNNTSFNLELINLTKNGRLVSEKDGTLKRVSFLTGLFEDLKGFLGFKSKTAHMKENISNYIVIHANEIQDEDIQLILQLAEKGGLIKPNLNSKNDSKLSISEIMQIALANADESVKSLKNKSIKIAEQHSTFFNTTQVFNHKINVIKSQDKETKKDEDAAESKAESTRDNPTDSEAADSEENNKKFLKDPSYQMINTEERSAHVLDIQPLPNLQNMQRTNSLKIPKTRKTIKNSASQPQKSEATKSQIKIEPIQPYIDEKTWSLKKITGIALVVLGGLTATYFFSNNFNTEISPTPSNNEFNPISILDPPLTNVAPILYEKEYIDSNCFVGPPKPYPFNATWGTSAKNTKNFEDRLVYKKTSVSQIIPLTEITQNISENKSFDTLQGKQQENIDISTTSKAEVSIPENPIQQKESKIPTYPNQSLPISSLSEELEIGIPINKIKPENIPETTNENSFNFVEKVSSYAIPFLTTIGLVIAAAIGYKKENKLDFEEAIYTTSTNTNFEESTEKPAEEPPEKITEEQTEEIKSKISSARIEITQHTTQTNLENLSPKEVVEFLFNPGINPLKKNPLVEEVVPHEFINYVKERSEKDPNLLMDNQVTREMDLAFTYYKNHKNTILQSEGQTIEKLFINFSLKKINLESTSSELFYLNKNLFDYFFSSTELYEKFSDTQKIGLFVLCFMDDSIKPNQFLLKTRQEFFESLQKKVNIDSTLDLTSKDIRHEEQIKINSYSSLLMSVQSIIQESILQDATKNQAITRLWKLASNFKVFKNLPQYFLEDPNSHKLKEIYESLRQIDFENAVSESSILELLSIDGEHLLNFYLEPSILENIAKKNPLAAILITEWSTDNSNIENYSELFQIGLNFFDNKFKELKEQIERNLNFKESRKACNHLLYTQINFLKVADKYLTNYSEVAPKSIATTLKNIFQLHPNQKKWTSYVLNHVVILSRGLEHFLGDASPKNPIFKCIPQLFFNSLMPDCNQKKIALLSKGINKLIYKTKKTHLFEKAKIEDEVKNDREKERLIKELNDNYLMELSQINQLFENLNIALKEYQAKIENNKFETSVIPKKIEYDETCIRIKLKIEELGSKLEDKRVCRHLSDDDMGFTILTREGGSQEVSYEYSKKGSVGIMIAANSGLPGGKLGKKDHVLTENDLMEKGNEENHVATVSLTENHLNIPEPYRLLNRIKGKWGMVDPDDTGYETIQEPNRNYVTSIDSEIYNDCYVVDNCNLANLKNKDSKGNPIPKKINKKECYQAGLFFVAGPCGNNTSVTGSMTRTRNEKAVMDYDFFKECAKVAIIAGLYSMILSGKDYAILAQISAGIYCPSNFQNQYRKEYPDLIKEIMHTKIPNGEKIGEYFKDVLLPMLPPSPPKQPKPQKSNDGLVAICQQMISALIDSEKK
jgi:hypothetical protein